MKCIKLINLRYGSTHLRVANTLAEQLVRDKKAIYIPKSLWKNYGRARV